MIDRREFLQWTSSNSISTKFTEFFNCDVSSGELKKAEPIRCINIVNFIRGVEPRFETDLLLPVRKQMELILKYKLPATWLLQYDALVAGDFVAFLKGNMARNHEVGFWFEMNEMLCDASKVKWRGRPGYEWDHLPPVAFTIGYSPEERILLADTAMNQFKAIWGNYPSSVASWNLDSITLAHLTEKYAVDAYAVCRDQIATDGFTIWGGPIAGYYPSKKNCWSPALSREHQIDTPIFRMLGQDPVHYYNSHYKLPDGSVRSEPDTMEPVWYAGKSKHFISSFLDMIVGEDCMKFAYAQIGQENSFPWDQMADGYPIQMAALAKLSDDGRAHIETMGDSGRRFKKAFKSTPTQAQIMLEDSFGNTDPSENSIWYQSRFYRANLHIRGNLPFLRDITVYSDKNSQPFLKNATRQNDVEQRLPAVLDGYHWSTTPDSVDTIGAGGFFEIDGQSIKLAGKPTINEKGNTLEVHLQLEAQGYLKIQFDEEGFSVSQNLESHGQLSLKFLWDPLKSALKKVEAHHALFSSGDFDYEVKVLEGLATATPNGWQIIQGREKISLHCGQVG